MRYQLFPIIFHLLPVKLRIKLSDLSAMASFMQTKRSFPIVFWPLNRCEPLYGVHLQENGNLETRCGLNCETFLELTAVGMLKCETKVEIASVDQKFPL